MGLAIAGLLELTLALLMPAQELPAWVIGATTLVIGSACLELVRQPLLRAYALPAAPAPWQEHAILTASFGALWTLSPEWLTPGLPFAAALSGAALGARVTPPEADHDASRTSRAAIGATLLLVVVTGFAVAWATTQVPAFVAALEPPDWFTLNGPAALFVVAPTLSSVMCALTASAFLVQSMRSTDALIKKSFRLRATTWLCWSILSAVAAQTTLTGVLPDPPLPAGECPGGGTPPPGMDC